MSTSNKYKLALDIMADTLHAQKSITALSNSIVKANLRTGMIGGQSCNWFKPWNVSKPLRYEES